MHIAAATRQSILYARIVWPYRIEIAKQFHALPNDCASGSRHEPISHMALYRASKFLAKAYRTIRSECLIGSWRSCATEAQSFGNRYAPTFTP